MNKWHQRIILKSPGLLPSLDLIRLRDGLYIIYVHVIYICICKIWIFHFILYMCDISIYLNSVIILFLHQSFVPALPGMFFKCFQNPPQNPPLHISNLCLEWQHIFQEFISNEFIFGICRVDHLAELTSMRKILKGH